MGAGDYTPSASGRAKPVTKAQIRRMQEDYARAEALSKEVLKQERQEQEKINHEMNDLLSHIF
ncbi:MAG: hypothetical protein PHH70_01625 [Candidatus Gracilibacteria bacterium]|nr:hypothetical protein [Candidatus Gracilibacteria bacterium]